MHEPEMNMRTGFCASVGASRRGHAEEAHEAWVSLGSRPAVRTQFQHGGVIAVTILLLVVQWSGWSTFALVASPNIQVVLLAASLTGFFLALGAACRPVD